MSPLAATLFSHTTLCRAIPDAVMKNLGNSPKAVRIERSRTAHRSCWPDGCLDYARHKREPMIILGLDPSLSCTGWGVIRVEGSRISHIANGPVKTDAKAPLPDRLAHLDTMIAAGTAAHAPNCPAVEEVFVHHNPPTHTKPTPP